MAKKKRRLSPKARAAALRNLRKARAKLHRPRRRRVKARVSRPSRRVRTMARKRRSGGRRKGLKITPKKLVQAGVALTGLKMIADADPIGYANYYAKNPTQLAKPETVIGFAKRFGPGIVVASVGPKVADKAISLATKAVPGSSKLANATIVRV